jgi:hypothetical protein
LFLIDNGSSEVELLTFETVRGQGIEFKQLFIFCSDPNLSIADALNGEGGNIEFRRSLIQEES